jgi:hypothetical protein|tara:strand:+ start:100 stop:879 length:780 start_codon:yes stop_codon:yes gene_type:complete
MSMTEVYQPVIIKELLNNNGKCTKTDLSVALARYDLSILDYYKKIVMRWPKDILTKHDVIQYQRNGELFLLNPGLVDLENPVRELEICEEKISIWIDKKKNIERSPQASESIRYKVLKRSNGKCELCGIPSSLRPIDIDHIVPQSTKNKNEKVTKDGKLIDVHSEENLQALCYKCNRAKRNTDNTDFRRTKKLVRDKIPSIIVSDGRKPKIKALSGHKLIEALNDKLIEEHEEYISEKDNTKSVKYGSFDEGYFYEGDE